MSLFFDPQQPKQPNGHVYIRSPSNPREFLFVEIQGEIKTTLLQFVKDDPTCTDKTYLWGQELGIYEETGETGECSLVIGNLKLIGTKEKLKKPYLILTKQKNNPKNDKSNLNLTPNLHHSHQSDPNSTTQKTQAVSNSLDSIIPSTFDTESIIQTSLEFENDSIIPHTLNRNDTICSLVSNFSPQTNLTLTPIEQRIEQTFSGQPEDYPSLLRVDGVVRYIVKFAKRPIPLVRSVEQIGVEGK
jgi:hypothetical protein